MPVSVKLAATVGRTSVIGQVAEAIATRDMEKLGCIAILGLGTRGPGRLSRVRPSDPISAGVRDLEPSDGITIRLPTSIEQLVVALKDLATKANQVRENGHLLPANQRELDHMLLTAIDTIRSCFEHGFRIEPGTSKVVRQRVDFVTTKNGIMDIEDVPNLLEDVPIFLRGLERGNPKAAEELLKHAMETVQANFRKAFF